VKPLADRPPHELLGVRPDAGPEEIRQAYERLTKLLAPGSLALYSLLATDQQRELQDSLRLATTLLLARHDQSPGHPENIAPPRRQAETSGGEPAAPRESVRPLSPGETLRAAREGRSLSLREASEHTRIPVASLESIEAEAYERLPLRAYLRGFVRTYAAFLRLDPDRTWEAYATRWQEAGFDRD